MVFLVGCCYTVAYGETMRTFLSTNVPQQQQQQQQQYCMFHLQRQRQGRRLGGGCGCGQVLFAAVYRCLIDCTFLSLMPRRGLVSA